MRSFLLGCCVMLLVLRLYAELVAWRIARTIK